MFVTMDVVFHEDSIYFSSEPELQGELLEEVQALDYDFLISIEGELFEPGNNLNGNEKERPELGNENVGELDLSGINLDHSGDECDKDQDNEVVDQPPSKSLTPQATDTPNQSPDEDGPTVVSEPPRKQLPPHQTRGIPKPLMQPCIQEVSNGSFDRPQRSSSVSVPSPSRGSTRVITRPGYLQDYHCSMVKTPPSVCTSPHSISHVLSYDMLSPSHLIYAMSISMDPEPKLYHQALKYAHWWVATIDELDAMESNDIWSVVPLPQDKKSIGCRWIFKNKYNTDGTISRFKPRLVAKGYS